MFLAQPFSSAAFSAIAPRQGAVFLSTPEINATATLTADYQRIRNNTIALLSDSDFIATGGYLKTFSPSIEVNTDVTSLGNVVYRPTVTVNGLADLNAVGYILGEEWSDTTFGSDTWNTISSGSDTWTEKPSSSNTWNKKG